MAELALHASTTAQGAPLLLGELDLALRQPAGGAPARMLGAITALFVRHADVLADEQVLVFDDVILRLVDVAETPARATLADRLATFDNAPLRLMRKLAHDEIVVARPVLLRSPRLNETDLVSVALTRGRDHMAAMAQRKQLASIVTDVLVLSGEAEVIRAVAANPGAMFSSRGQALLIERAGRDNILQATLHERGGAVSGPGGRAGGPRRPLDRGRFSAAASSIAGLFAQGRLSESQILAWAGQGALEEVMCSLAALANLPVPLVMRLFALSDEAGLMAVARRLGFAPRTVNALIALVAGEAPDDSSGAELAERYATLTVAAAERALRFTQMRAMARREPAVAAIRLSGG